jgi:hypothetical protein
MRLHTPSIAVSKIYVMIPRSDYEAVEMAVEDSAAEMVEGMGQPKYF